MLDERSDLAQRGVPITLRSDLIAHLEGMWWPCVVFALGVLTSLVATTIVALVGWWFGRHRVHRQYAGMVGDGYTGWGFVDDEAPELVRMPQAQSQASVDYVNRNILRIHVAHGGRRWTGEISMENEHFGTVVWRYTDMATGVESFGFKRIMVSKEPRLVKLLLVGERPFGLEVFERAY